jgi:hypothetical protein
MPCAHVCSPSVAAAPHPTTPPDRPETQSLASKYAGVVPAGGSVVDLLVRAKDRLTGQPLKTHQIVAQVRVGVCHSRGAAMSSGHHTA